MFTKIGLEILNTNTSYNFRFFNKIKFSLIVYKNKLAEKIKQFNV